MLNVGKIEEGFVLDHIPAGKSMSIYYHLGLDKLDCMVAIIKNVTTVVDKSGSSIIKRRGNPANTAK
jgi:aspartate carbamoyltransferase regulatory subunit